MLVPMLRSLLSRRLRVIGADEGQLPLRNLIVAGGQSLAAGRKLLSGAVAAGIPAAEVARVQEVLPSITLVDEERQHDAGSTLIYSTVGALQQRTGAGATPGDYSLELALGHDLNEYLPGVWAMAKFEVGGSDPNDWEPTGTYPSGGEGNLAHRLVAKAVEAERLTRSRWRLLDWIHGESAALDATFSADYGNFLNRLFTFIWSAHPDVQIAILRLSLLNTMPFAAEVRAAQDGIAALYPTKISIFRHDTVVLDSAATQGHPVESITMGNNAFPHNVNLIGMRLPLVADFQFEAQELVTDFFDVSSDPNVISTGIVGWSWDFGDGATSTTQHPSHTYATGGAYTVRLTVVGAGGGTATNSQTITVAVSTWPTDGQSGESFVTTAAEHTAWVTAHDIRATVNGVENTLMPTPHGWPCQDTATPIVDTFAPGGAKNLSTANLTAASFQKTISNYDRKAIGANGLATAQSAANATFPTGDVIHVGLVLVNKSTVNTRAMFADGSGTAINAVNVAITNGHMQKRTGSAPGIVTGAIDHANGVPHWYLSRFSSTDSVDDVLSDLEHVVVPYTAQTNGRVDLVMSLSSDVAASQDHFWHVRYDNVRMSLAQAKHYIQALGRRVRVKV